MWRGVLKAGAIAVVILIAAGMGLAAIMRWRETAKRTRCIDNLRQVAWIGAWSYIDPQVAFPNGRGRADVGLFLNPDAHIDAQREFPPGTLVRPGIPPEHRLSWMVVLLPHIGQGEVHALFDLALPWNSEQNSAAVFTSVRLLACPSQWQPTPAGRPAETHYLGMAGVGLDAPTLPASHARAGIFRYDEATKVGMIERGLSHTIAVMETGRDIGPWAAGGPSTVRGIDPTEPPVGPGRQFGGHPGGGNAAFADGSVRFQSAAISPGVVSQLSALRVQDQ